MIQHKNQSGFTLVEITIAMAIFGSVLVVVSIMLFGIIKIYRSSVAQRDTQNTANFAMDNIVRDVRLASSVIINQDTGSPEKDNFCLKVDLNKGFQYFVNSGVLYRRTISNPAVCSAPGSVQANDQTYSADNVQVLEMAVNDTKAGSPASNIGVTISLTVGSKSGIVAGGAVCQTGPGSEFCSVTKLNTAVTFRGGGS